MGVDFDQSGGVSPNNWTQVNDFSTPVSLADLKNEEGRDTTIGLSMFAPGTTAAATPVAATIPTHTQSLAGLDGFVQTDNPITMSWSGLTAGSQYEVWVFGLNGSEAISQRVEINNGQFAFDQIATAGNLAVNDETGNDTRSLDSYAQTVTVGFSASISMLVRVGTSFSLAGVAIREVVPPGPEINVLGNNVSIANNDLSADIADDTHFGGVDVFSGTTTHTFTIENIGDQNLSVTSITLSGDQANDFTLTNVTLPVDVDVNDSMTFDIQFDPSNSGPRETTVVINHSDSDESPFQFRILGIGTFNILPDAFEPNDSLGAPFDLGTGDQRHDDLTIHASGNLDDFLWQSPADGTLTVQLLFEHDFGDLELRLRRPDPPFFPILGIAQTQTDNEQLSIDVVENQQVIIEVFGFLGGLQPDYDLLINGPEPIGPEIVVQGSGTVIVDDDPLPSSVDGTDFGIVSAGGGPIIHTFTIQNIGTQSLNLTGAPVTIGGINPEDFSVTQPAQTTIAPDGNTTFEIAFHPGAAGLRTAVISIGNDDSDENPYEFAIRGFVGTSRLVGVDFGDPTTTLTNWTPVGAEATPLTLNDLVTESGVSTDFDLEINYPGGTLATSSATADVATVPVHLQALDGIDGQIFMAQPNPNITLTWKDLTPFKEYEVWVFAMDPEFGIMQDFTLTGANSVRIGQIMSPGQLYINGEVGDFTVLLDTYAERITASASGEIEIFLQPFIRGIVAPSSVEAESEVVVQASSRNDAVLSAVAIREVNFEIDSDFGDAPLASQSGFLRDYPTLLPDGARHAASTLRLGTALDTESDGQPNAAADGDGSDEDGVSGITSLITTTGSDTTTSILVTASAAGKLDGWIDFNQDGDWLDQNEQLFASSIDVSAGQNTVSITVPAGASSGDTYARFRLSSAGGLSPDGPADDGEVEDYRIQIIDGNGNSNVLGISFSGPGGAPDPEDLPGGPQPASWLSQRSDLREIVVQLATPISAPTASDLVLTNLGLNAPVDPDVVIPLSDSHLSLSSDGMQLRISFAAAELGDGVYQLDLLAAITGGTTFTFTGDATNNFFVLTGDWTGSGGVNIQDFATLAYWFGNLVPDAPDYVDVNGSGGINIQDFAGFAANFGTGIVFPGTTAPLAADVSGEGELELVARTLVNPIDVNGDGAVTMRDALNVFNAIDRRELIDELAWADADVNRDGLVSAADALFVFDRLTKDVVMPDAVDRLLSDEAFVRNLF